jgi:endonuclease/exonuclease/phosphatase family metal-dependent hydrolase
MKIWMLTWNCENQAPKDSLFDQFCNELLPASEKAQWPDILVIALQEADCYFSLRRLFVTHKIAEKFSADYQLLSAPSFMGTTKPPTKCYIHLGVLVRKRFLVFRDPNRKDTWNPLRDANSQAIDQGSGEYRDGKFPKCKGGAFARVNYADKNLGFIGAHLDGPVKATACNRQIQALLRSITNSTATNAVGLNADLNQQFDALFFMGDLNYRLSTGAGKPTVNEMVSAIGQTQTRKNLWAYDTLNGTQIPPASHSPLVTAYGFTFPHFDSLPTYKRSYKDRTSDNPCLRLSPRMLASAGELTTPGVRDHLQIQSNQSMLQACYFQGQIGSDSAHSVKRQGYYELGWLDRIGFRIKPGTTVVVNSIQFKALDAIVLSDHTPIMMKIELT